MSCRGISSLRSKSLISVVILKRNRMKLASLLFGTCILFICSCSPINTRNNKLQNEKHEILSYESYVAVATIYPKGADHVKYLLESNGIPSNIHGSIAYGVEVPPEKQEQAIALLKKDAQKHKYYLSL